MIRSDTTLIILGSIIAVAILGAVLGGTLFLALQIKTAYVPKDSLQEVEDFNIEGFEQLR